jgi:hypothetical protein
MKQIILLLVILFTYRMNSQNRYDTPSGQKYQSQYVPTNFELYEKMLKEKQQKDQKTGADKIMRLKDLYINALSYPKTISDGFHDVEITDNVSDVSTIQIYVENNKVTHFAINGVKDEKVVYSSEITKGKALIKFNLSGVESSYYDLYFIQDIYK